MDFALAIYVLLYNNTKGVFPIEAFRLEVYLLLSVILFSDETSFTRDSVNNLRNVHTWYQDNPHETSVTNFQMRFTVNSSNRRIWPNTLTKYPEEVVETP